jgi:hypothetical protein
MSRTLQFKRYANTAIANTTGANGELIIDTTNKTITVHDGTTVGGRRIATEIYVTQQINSNYSIDGQIFDKANTANVLAQSAFNQANTANVLAQSAFNQANSANVLAQSAFNQANSANVLAQSAFNQANSANVLAQNAYNAANTAAQTIPQNVQTANYTLQLSDAGKYLYYTQSANVTLYIPTTADVPFQNGTTIMIVSKTTSSANVTITPNTGVSMYLVGNTTSASRNVNSYGIATLLLADSVSNTWFFST